ncbi:MAG TPA: AraC family transcriptional regulator [Puia sp.]|nr:AraC family transcriptional regulator [Puia sp.]
MTFYEEQIRAIRAAVYPRADLSRQIVLAKEYMNRNFSERLDLDGIAGRVFISKYHFLRLFKLHYGMTPHQYLTMVRLQEAKLLVAKGVPVSEVCAAVGFDSISSFKGLFKRYWGKAPAAWKKAIFEIDKAGNV